MKRICEVMSGGPDSPSCIHHPHILVIPAHDTSGVGWVFIAISVTATRGKKGKKRAEDGDSDDRYAVDMCELLRFVLGKSFIQKSTFCFLNKLFDLYQYYRKSHCIQLLLEEVCNHDISSASFKRRTQFGFLSSSLISVEF